MPQVINTNVMSLNAQKNLNKSQNMLSTSLQRLSSGLRINSAKDDAAGLAISNRMTSQIRGINQAARNASDAISLAQTGEGGLQEVTNNLQRMRELAVQSRNATNTETDRKSLDAEFQQLLSEVDRIAQTTSFNGRNVLDGSLGTSVFQVGANVGETVSIDVSSSIRSNAIGKFASVSYNLGTDSTATDGDTLDVDTSEVTINGEAIAAAADNANGAGDGSALSIAAAINANSADHGVTASAGAATNTASSSDIAGFSFDSAGASGDLYTLQINGTTVYTQDFDDANASATSLASAINGSSSTTGVVAKVDTNGSLQLTASDGRNIEIFEGFTVAGTDGDDGAGYFGNSIADSSVGNFEISKGALTLTSKNDINVAFTSGALTADTEVLFGLADGTGTSSTTAQTLVASDILTASNSDLAMQRIDQALSDVDTLRGTFGAIQSRFESTVSNLQTTAENVSAARSRIRDADFASETAALTSAQVLQQAGVSVLTQANAQPQLALSLLQ
jgi:flagellin